MSDIINPNYRYTMVEFLDEKTDKKSIDFVPTNWLFKDSRGVNMYCPFIDSTTACDIKELKKLVKNNSLPPKTWSTFRVKPCGQAGKSHFISMYLYIL